MEIQRIAVKSLALNEGQVEGLPRNPRTWTRDELDRLARSIEETPELFEARPVLAYDWKDGEPFIVLGGNMRLTAAKQLGWKDVPCIVYPRGTERDKLAEIVIKDNGAFGSWDWDALANEWDSLPLDEWGVPTWKVDAGLTGELPSDLDMSDEEKNDRERDCFIKVSFKSPQSLQEFLDKYQSAILAWGDAAITTHGGAL